MDYRVCAIVVIVALAASQTYGQELVNAKSTDYDYDYNTCLDDERQCNNSSLCILKSSWCNGTAECPDGSDEANCTAASATTTATTTTTEGGYDYYGNCPDTEFECGDGNCIELSLKCNGMDDCVDGSDELNCPVTTKPTTMPTTMPTTTASTDYDYGCLGNEFQCTDGICIPESAICDGTYDCGENEDETNCTTTSSSIASSTVAPSTVAPSTVAQSTIASVSCWYQGQLYPTGSTIVETNCTEVSCSNKGHILTWNNPDSTCGVSTISPTLSCLISLLCLAFFWLQS